MRQDLKDRFQIMVLAELPRLRRFALHVCGDVHRADDHVQGALERMYVAWPRMHDVAWPGAYLRAILVRHMLNEKRRPWRREHSTEELPDAGYDSIGRTDLGLDLTRALSGLTTRQRAVVVLRYIEDRPISEVAQIMGTTPGTVKRQCSEAVGKLRVILGEDFVEDAAEGDGARALPARSGASASRGSGDDAVGGGRSSAGSVVSALRGSEGGGEAVSGNGAVSGRVAGPMPVLELDVSGKGIQ